MGAIRKFPYPDAFGLGSKGNPFSLVQAARNAVWKQSRESFLKNVIKVVYGRNDDEFYFDYYLPVLSLENSSPKQTVKFDFKKIKNILKKYQKHLSSFTKINRIGIRHIRKPSILRARPHISTCAILNTLRRDMELELGVNTVEFNHDSDLGYFLSYGGRNYPT